jgi:hypothetical protein
MDSQHSWILQHRKLSTSTSNKFPLHITNSQFTLWGLAILVYKSTEMPIIYVKLGVGVNNYFDERLDFALDSTYKPAGMLDYTNLTEDINSGLNAGTIIQIDEKAYNDIISTFSPPEVNQISTNYLITLGKFLQGCPVDATEFFCLSQGQWFKILWKDLKGCVLTSGRLNILFKVGTDAGINIPNVGANSFSDPLLIGRSYRNLIVKTGNLEIFHKSYYAGAELDANDYYDLDPVGGLLTRPLTFQDKEIFSIREV